MLHPNIKCNWGKNAQCLGLISHGSFHLVNNFLLGSVLVIDMSSQVGEKDDMKFKIKMNRQSPIYREIIFQNKINEEKRISIDTN